MDQSLIYAAVKVHYPIGELKTKMEMLVKQNQMSPCGPSIADNIEEKADQFLASL